MRLHPRPGHRLLPAIAIAIAFVSLTGCGPGLPPFATESFDCQASDPPQVNVVLTFDDGPFSADSRITADESPEDVLAALNQILAVLQQRNARAVFFIAVHVAEPVTSVIPEQRADVFARGLQQIHDAGHVLGYHAFNHDTDIWANLTQPPPISFLRMSADLVQLKDYIDRALAPTGQLREALFAPIFRQPFGGIGICAFEGVAVAGQMHWSYHGYHIDSGDWTGNLPAEPEIARRLSIEAPDARHAFVRSRLRAGAAAGHQQDVVDVLLHVNTFTAAHLDEWIDTLEEGFQSQNRGEVRFDVPDCYITQTNPFMDPAVFTSVLTTAPPPP